MDRRSWLWRRKSSEKSPGETESCGSVSSYSERYSDDQEVSKASPNPTRSPEVCSNVASCEDSDTVKSLTEKLASALLDIRAKEELVNQHAKVAEEAVSGWEKAEKEVISLRRQLETAAQKNTTLEDRIGQLDGALTECVRQLQQSRKEQEQKLQDALVKKAREWESEKFEFESRLIDLEVQLEAAKGMPASVSHDLQFKLEEIEKENAILKSELLARSEELNMRTLERDLSSRAAETASKQHLESTKKVGKLEAECRMLQAMVRRSSSGEHKPYVKPVSVVSHGDGPSGSREGPLWLDKKASCSDAWASALIAELDQFKSGRAVGQDPTATCVEIDLMDDFLEMEKLVALPETNPGDPSADPRVDPSTDDTRNNKLEAELKASLERISELEENERRMEAVNAEMDRQLAETQDRLEATCKLLKETEMMLVDLHGQLQLAKDSKQAAEIAAGNAEVQRKLLESHLQSADLMVQELNEKVALLEGKMEEERVLSEELTKKCRNLEDELSGRKREAEIRRAAFSNEELKIKQEKELAVAAQKFAECQNTIASMRQQLRSLATLDDFTCEGEKVETNGASPPVSEGEKKRKMRTNDASPPLSTPSSSSHLQNVHKSLPQGRVNSCITKKECTWNRT